MVIEQSLEMASNAKRLEDLRALIRNKLLLRAKFEARYDEITKGTQSGYRMPAKSLWRV